MKNWRAECKSGEKNGAEKASALEIGEKVIGECAWFIFIECHVQKLINVCHHFWWALGSSANTKHSSSSQKPFFCRHRLFSWCCCSSIHSSIQVKSCIIMEQIFVFLRLLAIFFNWFQWHYGKMCNIFTKRCAQIIIYLFIYLKIDKLNSWFIIMCGETTATAIRSIVFFNLLTLSFYSNSFKFMHLFLFSPLLNSRVSFFHLYYYGFNSRFIITFWLSLVQMFW